MSLQPTSLSPLAPLSTRAGSGDKARAVARDMEALFASMMLKSMRNSIMKGNLTGENMGEKIYTEMLDTEYAGMVANEARLGLADLIVKEIERRENTSALKGNAAAGFSTPYASSGSPFTSTFERVMQWNGLIEEASGTFNVDANLVRAVIAQESAGNPNAVSHAGAKGLMQLIDSTAREMGVSQVFNPRQNIMGGTRYLASMLKRFGNDIQLALASYNAGPGAVERYGTIPPYRETQNYVRTVLASRERFAARTTPEPSAGAQ